MTQKKSSYNHSEQTQADNGKVFRIALAGNPNSGRTTIFNALTGDAKNVGNYPGVTVERTSSVILIGGCRMEIIDLPGVYSLSDSGENELEYKDFYNGSFDLILNVIDAGSLKRNLLLATELFELKQPTLLVFSMADEAREQGLVLDHNKIKEFTSCESLECTAVKKQGIDELKTRIWKILTQGLPSIPSPPSFGEEADSVIALLAKEITLSGKKAQFAPPDRFCALRLMENAPSFAETEHFTEFKDMACECAAQLVTTENLGSGTFMSELRYGYIEKFFANCVTSLHPSKTISLTDRIDALALNRFLGLPIFLLIMFAVFAFTFIGANPFTRLMGDFFAWGADSINSVWPSAWPDFLRALISEGIIGGVGGVLVFLPNIVFLFLALAILEDTGYMTRAAFVMDGFMHIFGLHGKSFIPMLLGFGCTVPAVMATRTIENERDRKATIFVLPLMSCGARLPIYSMIIPAFFPEAYQALMMWIIYITGIIVALIGARILKSTMFKSENDLFILEMPPYRLPGVKTVFATVGDEAYQYLKKAGTLILLFSIAIFIMSKYPEKKVFDADYDAQIAAVQNDKSLDDHERKEKISLSESNKAAESLEYSSAGRIGKVLSYAFAPLGFDWKVSSSLVGALAAKELFVSQMGILHAAHGNTKEEKGSRLIAALKHSYTPLQGFVIMIFCLLTLPCIGTLSVVYKETKSLRFTVTQALTLTATAYVLAFAVYHAGLWILS